MALRGSDYEPDPLMMDLRSAPQRRIPITTMVVAGVAIVLVILGSAAVYRFLGSAPRPAPGASAAADLGQVQQQLVSISKRLDRLEKEQRRDSDQLADLSAKQAAAAKQSNAAAAAGEHAAPPQKVVVVKQVPTPDPAVERKLAALENNADANKQAWNATTNQLADMAGQLGAAQGAIDQNQRALSQLLAGTPHNLVRFYLRRGAKEQRVGPVSMYLKTTDSRRQHYTLQVLVNDHWTELKDRALNEVVQFFVPQFNDPLELVATDIGRDTLGGYLAVPVAKPSH